MLRRVGERASVRSGGQVKIARKPRRRTFSGITDLITAPQAENLPIRPIAAPKPAKVKVDVPLLLSVVTLVIFGLLMVYSASYDYSLGYYGDPSGILKRQFMWLGVGIISLVVMTMLDYHYWRYLSLAGMVVTVPALIAVLIVKEVRNGAVRTLFGGSVQPSELAKLVLVVYLAVWLFSKREQIKDIGFGMVPLIILVGGLASLIGAQPDLSAVMTIVALGGIMFFLAGGELKQIGFVMLVSVALGWILIQFHPTGSDRLNSFLAGLQDPTNASNHIKRAYEAFVRGGWFGVGIGNSETKLTGLPVPHTDSIFAVVAEETGAFGALVLVGLYLLLVWRGLRIAMRAPDQLGSLLAAGLSLWIAFDAFINIAGMLNLIPFAGNALPFISAGGSNLIVSLTAIGIMMSVSRFSIQREQEGSKIFNAFAYLRRRNRRRRVPSPSRPGKLARG